MKLYRASFSDKIDEVESERQTEHSVFINGFRNAWKGSYNCYFTTYQEAKEHIINNCSEKQESAKKQYDYWTEKLNKANQL